MATGSAYPPNSWAGDPQYAPWNQPQATTKIEHIGADFVMAQPCANPPSFPIANYEPNRLRSYREYRMLVSALRKVCKDKKANSSQRLRAAELLIQLNGYLAENPNASDQRKRPLAKLGELTKSVNIVTNNVNHEQSPEK